MLNNWPFFHLFILDNLRQKNVFYDILERKNAVLFNKKWRSESRKIQIFQKGLVRELGQNWPFLHIFIFANIDQENVLYVFLRYKNK